jgi:DNA-binding MarR family transcriptional regulator
MRNIQRDEALTSTTIQTDEIEEPLTDTIRAIERLLPRIARALLFDVAADSPLWDLPLPQMRALFTVGHRKSCTMGDLADRLGVAMSTVTQIADRLEQRGWLRRVHDPEDRRVVRLALTEEGRELVEERRRQRRERLEEALLQMPADSRQALLLGLRALHEVGGCGTGREHSCATASSLLDWVREDLEAASGGD